MKSQKLKSIVNIPKVGPKVDPKVAVKKLITNLKIMYYNQDPMLDGIDNFQNLYSALCDLDDIVGMYDIKKSIVDQIKFLLVNYTGGKSKFEGHMLHTLICGAPGTGKTTVAVCLSNIWNALGLLKKETPKLNESKSAFGLKSQKERRNAITVRGAEPKEGEETKKSKFDDIFLMALIGLMSEKSKEKGEKADNDEASYKEYKEYKDYKSEPKKIKEQSLIKYVKPTKNDDQIEPFESVSESGSNLGDLLRHRRYTSAGINNIRKTFDTKKVDSFKKLERVKFGNDSIKIVSRPDFVGLYLGHTADRTKTLLTNTMNDGKVLFIDEAYSLINDTKDSFGHESLDEINRFMSENPGLIIIFAGYKDRIENTIFKAQSGLKRRITWSFEITKYSGDMLSTIFKQQLANEKWVYDGDEKELNKFFEENLSHFEAFGGDCQRLVFYCKLTYSELKFDFDSNSGNKLKNKTITHDIFMSAYENMYCINKPKPEINMSYQSMYC